MKVTPRENLLSLYRREGYAYAPAEIMLCPAQLRRFTQETGRPERKLAEHFSFPFRNVQDLRQTCVDTNAFLRYFPGGLKQGARVSGWGVAHEPGSTEHFTHMRHPLAGDITMDDLLAYPFPKLNHENAEEQKQQAKNIKQAGFAAYGHMSCTVWETSWYMRGMEELMMDMLDYDERAEYILDYVTDMSVERARSYARAGVDVLLLGDDVGMQCATMMSGELYRAWLKPRLSNVIRAAREIKPDILVQYHSCGYVRPLIDDLIEVGIDILNPVQPECMDFAEIHAKYGGRLSFNGTLGTQTAMPFGSPDDVYQKVHKNLDIAGSKGGLFACPTHVVEPEVPWENIMAYFEACREYK